MTYRKFRPDIEILRAFAVISVVIAHSKITLASGFIGVDVFFVISGFLITKHLFDEIQNTGTISLSSFYSRRILRIFPASMLVLVLTLIGSIFFLSPLQIINYCWDAFYSGISAVNYRFAITGTDYFQATSTQSPFQHFWSLAVEEQFYLVWPFILILISKLVIRKKSQKDLNLINNESDPSDILHIQKNHFKNFDLFGLVVTCFLIVVICSSLYLSYSITMQSQPWAYFSIHTRAWQMAIGSILAFNLQFLSRINTRTASILSWVGFGGLIASLALISEATVYPGLWAILPTVSTAIIIASGTNFNKNSFEWVFDNKVIRFIGKISYSLYLIHWPVFVFVFYNKGDSINIRDQIAAIQISIMLSVASLYLVENPIRFNQYLKKNYLETAKIGIFLIMFVTTLSLGIQFLQNQIINGNVISVNANTISENQLNQKIKSALDIKELPQDLQKPVDKVAIETGSGCIAIEVIKTPQNGPKCRLGDKNSKKTIVILGDSHANQWVDALDLVAQQNNYLLLPFTKAGCSMTDIKHFNPILKRDYTECYLFRKAVLEEIQNINPDITITSELTYQESNNENYTKFLQKLTSISQKVIRLEDTPKPTKNIPECVTKNFSDIQKCSFVTQNGNNKSPQNQSYDQIANTLSIKTIDTKNWFCINGICPPIINNHVVYNDDSHVSDSYTLLLSQILNKKLFGGTNLSNQNVTDATKINTIPDKLNTPLEKAVGDSLFDLCKDNYQAKAPEPKNICTFGNPNSPRTIVLIGDSHAQHWIKALEIIAKDLDYRLITYTKSSCSLANDDLYDFFNKKDYTECTEWRKAVLDQVEKISPNVIISSESSHPNSSIEKYIELMIRLKTISKKVIRINDTPRSEFSIPECLVKNKESIQNCSYKVQNAIYNPEAIDQEIAESEKLGISTINPLEWFCAESICPPIIDNNIVFTDSRHISNTYSGYLAEELKQKIKKVFPEIQNQ
jgi:peptidoglycan/LPS O-acetylase OafA/YrhL